MTAIGGYFTHEGSIASLHSPPALTCPTRLKDAITLQDLGTGHTIVPICRERYWQGLGMSISFKEKRAMTDALAAPQ